MYRSEDPLPRAFYERPTETVARELLGAVVVRRLEGETLAGRIVETEAYLGGNDQAAHSYAGVTPRTSVIFGPGGHAYVYFIYGVHHCLNLIAQPAGVPGCVLVRALEPVSGLDMMRLRRGRPRKDRDLASGPGKLCQALGIGLAEYGADVTDPTGALTVLPSNLPAPLDITVSTRIGIRRSADLPLRFFIRDNEHVSRK